MTDSNYKCPFCKRLAIKLISIKDNGKGRKVCRDCKRKELK